MSTKGFCRHLCLDMAGRGIGANRLIVVLVLMACSFGSMPAVSQTEMPLQSVQSPETERVFNDFGTIFGIPPYVLRAYQFAASDSQARVEVRFGLANDVLQFVKEDDEHYHASYEANVAVLNGAQTLVASKTWKRSLFVSSFDATNDRARLNEERVELTLPLGRYEMKLEVIDLDSRKRLLRQYPLELKTRSAGQLSLSSIVLGDLPEEGLDSLHYNLIGVMSDRMSRPVAFFEIYGSTAGDTLAIHYQIESWKQERLQDWQTTVVASDSTIRHVESLGRRLLNQGPQKLRVTVRHGNKEAQGEFDFRTQLFHTAERTVANAKQPVLLYQPLRYISRGAEYKRIAESALDQRDSLIAAFWLERDPTSGTEENELRDEFYRRVSFSDTRFSIYGVAKSGWETDRGRVYIVYGPPREVHHQLGEGDEAPYEIWYYTDKSLYFVFQDKSGSGEFKLINR